MQHTIAGTNFSYTLVASSGAVSTILSQGSNTAGVFIRTLLCTNLGAGSVFIYGDTTTPSTGQPDTSRRIIHVTAGNANGTTSSIQLPIYLPAGNGIFASASVSSQVFITYDLIA